MGRDLTLYPKQATKNDLKGYLEGLGFEKCDHLWFWPKGTLNYFWFDSNDFKSIEGVSADIYPLSGDDLRITGNHWALHVRNRIWASWYDVKMLNDVLKGAKKLFGGKTLGDYGTNRYAPLWKDDSTPISRGVAAVYRKVEQELSIVEFALPDPIVNHSVVGRPKSRTFDNILRPRDEDFIEFTNSMDPSRVIYNGLVPFAVSMFEFFFSRIFQVLIAYDKFALEKRTAHKMKVDFDDLLAVGNGGQTVESVIAGNYSFQNLNQLNKAYKEWLDIDVRRVLYSKRKIGTSVKFLENKIEKIIQHRHGVVHHFQIDRSLTKNGYIEILEAVSKSMIEFIGFIEKKYNMHVERD